MLSTVGNVRAKALLRSENLSMPAFTDTPWGQLRCTITLRLSEFGLLRVMKGKQ